jgi:hypothetical protein
MSSAVARAQDGGADMGMACNPPIVACPAGFDCIGGFCEAQAADGGADADMGMACNPPIVGCPSGFDCVGGFCQPTGQPDGGADADVGGDVGGDVADADAGDAGADVAEDTTPTRDRVTPRPDTSEDPPVDVTPDNLGYTACSTPASGTTDPFSGPAWILMLVAGFVGLMLVERKRRSKR